MPREIEVQAGVDEIAWRTEERWTIEYVRDRLRNHSKQVGGQKALADLIGVSGQFVNDIINGRRMPGPKIFEFFGIEKVVEYIKLRDQGETIGDELGNTWDAFCGTCCTRSMHVVRPGDARCFICD